MGVAADAQASVDVSVIARIGGGGGYYALLQENEALGGFERGAGRIGTAEGAVEQWQRLVGGEHLVVLSAGTPHEQARVIAGRGYQAEDFAGLGLDGYHRAALADHERFGILLKLDVEAELEIPSRYGLDVVGAVLIAALDASACVADKDFHALYSAQIGFVGAFHPEVAGVVAGSIV